MLPNKINDWVTGMPAGFKASSSQWMLWIARLFFVIMSIGVGTSVLFHYHEKTQTPLGVVCLISIIVICGLVIWADILTRNKQITTISAVFFGLLMGFILSSLIWEALKPIIDAYLGPPSSTDAASSSRLRDVAPLFISLIACYLSVSLLLQTKDDFRFLIPYVEFSKQLKGAKPLVLDTSVIIDGRIADICDTGIIDTKLVVPRFVLQELQGIADSSDKIKRNRGRRGLDILKRMQNNPKVEVQLHEANLAELREVHKVDERLVVLAKHLSGRVVTNDFNLNKICQVQSVEVINLNELANALKLLALPGELLSVKIVKQGDQFGQGVGYLDDGTMIVVEQGRGSIGSEVPIQVTSVLQTPAGRMIFGRIEPRPGGQTPTPPG